VTACSGGSGKATPSSTPTPSSTSPTQSPSATAAALAAKGANASYSATYRLVGGGASAKPTEVRIFRLPRMLRVDVVSGGTTASLIQNPKGAYSCSARGKARTCFFVAKPGQPVPPLFDAGLQRVFSTYLLQLGTNADKYDVTSSGTTEASGSLPAGTCFEVKARPDSPAPKVADGTYCLADSGLLTKVTYPSGTLSLVSLTGPPTTSVIQPYSSPTPIP
jgi:hypothetical protein